jgi:hypothetical protein
MTPERDLYNTITIIHNGHYPKKPNDSLKQLTIAWSIRAQAESSNTKHKPYSLKFLAE